MDMFFLDGVLFNSHPHKEDDISSVDEFRSILVFNSHPHKEDDDFCPTWKTDWKFFNSHPHKEDDSNFKQKHSV